LLIEIDGSINQWMMRSMDVAVMIP